jgi:hypothetical protein
VTRRRVDLTTITSGVQQTLRLDQIREHTDTQPREQIQMGVVEEYADEMAAREDGIIVNGQGQPWPALIVYASPTEAGTYWLADGYHRLAAARRRGMDKIQVELHEGELRDAILHSVGANSTHGLRRSQADGRRAVRRLLADEEWVRWSNEEIARRCLVSPPTVATVRRKMEEEGAIEAHIRRIGSDGREQYTRHQGRKHTFPTEQAPSDPSSETPSAERRPAVPATRQTTARWDELARLKGADYSCAVCHWETTEHLRAVAERGLELLAPDGALVVPIPQGDQLAQLILALESKKRERGLRGPVVVVTGSLTALVVWIGGDRTLPVKVQSLGELISTLTGLGRVLHVSTEGGGPAL